MTRIPAVLLSLIALSAACSEKAPDHPVAPKSAELSAAAAGAGALGESAAKGAGAMVRDAAFYVARGLQKEAMKDKKGALQDYSSAIKLSPKHAQAHFSRGTLRAELGQCPGAKSDLERSAQLDAVYKPQIPHYINTCRNR